MTAPEPPDAGDYGYDLAHEDAPASSRRPTDTCPRPARPDPDAAGADYGYDEAHDF